MPASDYYLPGAKIPPVFLEADRQAAERHKNEPKQIEQPKQIPMPIIEGCKGTKGPVIVTEDWYVKMERKRLIDRAKNKKNAQIDMMRLISKKERLQFKLGELDPRKKRDAKEIVAINVKIKDIDAQLKALQEESGINLNELDHGTKLGRFVGKVKRFFRKACKKVKKFYKRNKELICGIAAIALPVIIGGLVKKLLGVVL